MNQQSSIRIAHSLNESPTEAVKEFYAGVVQPNMAFVIFFCSNAYDRTVLALEMAAVFAGVQVIGCTTAGEIGPAGYCTPSLVGASFSAADSSAVTTYISDLKHFDAAAGHALVQDLLQHLEAQSPDATHTNTFAFLLIDGLSIREEIVSRVLQGELGHIPLLGGSAGDGLNFGETYIYSEGRFHENSAVLLLCHTQLPFKIFKTQHFVPTEQRMVVTQADDAHRIVYELNGLPAALEYARLVGVNANSLDPMRFATFPVVVMINDAYFVRSIQQANPDNSLTFFCAIEEGVVLRLAKGVDLLENLQQVLNDVQNQIGKPQLLLVCECTLRKLEIFQSGVVEPMNTLLKQHNAMGFNTYGEEYCGVHINQTFVAIGFGQEVSGD
jgi:hypothetical protein